MNIMILNFSGNVGKSTLAKYLFEPRLPNCKVYSVESVNENEHEEENIRGNSLGIILDDMVNHDNCLLDIGSSNSETVISLLSKYRNAHEDFDAFVIPVIDKKKVISDSLSTARELIQMGVPADKIIIILNQIDIDTDIAVSFYELKMEDGITLSFDEELQIPTHDFFGRIAGTGKDLLDITSDEKDYAKIVRETPKNDVENLSNAVLMRALQRLAASLNEDFDEAFKLFESKLEA